MSKLLSRYAEAIFWMARYVERAENIARVAEENGVPTLCEFFGPEVAERLVRERRRVLRQQPLHPAALQGRQPKAARRRDAPEPARATTAKRAAAVVENPAPRFRAFRIL